MTVSPEEKQARIDDLCEMVAEGMTIRQIASHFGVTSGRILQWVGENENYSKQYARARDSAADLFETEIIEAALAAAPETAAADRVKIDALKWVAARRAPKRYGERAQVDHTSSDGSMTPMPTTIVLAAPDDNGED